VVCAICQTPFTLADPTLLFYTSRETPQHIGTPSTHVARMGQLTIPTYAIDPANHCLTFCRPPVELIRQRMHSIDTPLFATPCIGATIAHVHVFPTHIRYEQKFGRDISVAVDTIALVQKRVYEYGFVILSTTSRRRIICMVDRKRVERVYNAIREAQQSGEGIATTRTLPVFPPKESKHSRAREPVKAKPYGLLRKP
jgi:hypothetical protein